MRMQANRSYLDVFEEILSETALKGLKHLQIEIPAAGRLPNTNFFALHTELESLIIGVTDSDGRLMPFESAALQVVAKNCPMLGMLGLTLPPMEQAGNLRGPFRDRNISTPLIMGVAEATPPIHSPAWVQHCPQRADYGPCYVDQSICAEDCHTLDIRSGAGSNPSKTMSVGVHLGTYYYRF
ncbi:hypothetical protein GQ43DRAFT_476620 [Delitschia confertaspora ATCC 74209]|uniref:Uncharacterized protein n=1 Tax=Delitschia confertaspora ATCC 74209 TaxID=1513339 RepID=A0A9P4JE08_9PLEO|nr:hypothetical protein GQ43DRAFT_476620 [Delitschia confertaspora ATCC 74209]